MVISNNVFEKLKDKNGKQLEEGLYLDKYGFIISVELDEEKNQYNAFILSFQHTENMVGRIKNEIGENTKYLVEFEDVALNEDETLKDFSKHLIKINNEVWY